MRALAVARGGTVHGGQWVPFEKVSEKISEMGMNNLMLHGDIINFFKFLSPIVDWSGGVNIPAFDIFNGVSGTICGVAMTSAGVKGRRVAQETGDTHGKTEANWTVAAGLSLIALSLFKLGYAILGVWNFIKPLAARVFSWIGTLGTLNGITTVIMFFAYAVRAAYREREVHRFRDSYRECLVEVLQDVSREGTAALPTKGTPEALFDLAFKSSRQDVEVFSKAVLEKLCARMDREKEGVNFKHQIERATKGDIVKEIRSGHPESEEKPQPAKAVMDHLFAKWKARRDWNRALGIVSVVAIGLVVFLMCATPGSMALLASGLIVGLFVVFAAFFDGKGVGVALAGKEPGKWDGLIFLSQTVLLMAGTTALIIGTVMTGGALPILAYCIAVSSLLMVVQLVALGWTAVRLAQQRRERGRSPEEVEEHSGVLDSFAKSVNALLGDLGEDFALEPIPAGVS